MGVAQRRCDVRHELLTWRALFFVLESMQKGHAESAFRDACRTSSGRGRGRKMPRQKRCGHVGKGVDWGCAVTWNLVLAFLGVKQR